MNIEEYVAARATLTLVESAYNATFNATRAEADPQARQYLAAALDLAQRAYERQLAVFTMYIQPQEEQRNG